MKKPQDPGVMDTGGQVSQAWWQKEVSLLWKIAGPSVIVSLFEMAIW
jgi:hypothetical protein